eukprot:5404195-Prorocentrum_lima.AAC.1
MMTLTCQSGGKVLDLCIHIVAGSSRSGSCKLRRQYHGTLVGCVGCSVSSCSKWMYVEEQAP